MIRERERERERESSTGNGYNYNKICKNVRLDFYVIILK